MENEYREYATFHITAKDGSDVEMAVVDEFDFENKHYVVGAAEVTLIRQGNPQICNVASQSVNHNTTSKTAVRD